MRCGCGSDAGYVLLIYVIAEVVVSLVYSCRFRRRGKDAIACMVLGNLSSRSYLCRNIPIVAFNTPLFDV